MLSKIKSILVVLLLLTVMMNCFENPLNEIKETKIYAYAGFDSTGVKIVAGLLEIKIENNNRVTGNWKFDKIGNPENIGPQTGSGNLSGSLQDSILSLNLNPNYVDNNVLLNAIYDAHTMNGDWMWIGFSGPINHGTFKAVR